ncbi:MAG: hypothetical protein ACYDA3_03140 [Gaiellaceae bacterium]
MRRLELALLLAVVALVAALLLVHSRPERPPSPYCRSGPPLAGVYHADRLALKRRCDVVAGVVTKVKFEAFDGDVHIDLREDGGGTLVVEIIPQDRSAVPVPDTGTHVTVVGPRVDDLTHGWPEIHPAWWISAGRIVPASTAELTRVESLLGAKEGR